MPHATSSRLTLPVDREVEAAAQGRQALSAYLATRQDTQRIQIFDEDDKAHQMELPTAALRLLLEVLTELAEGNAVQVVPVHAELSTQEAADLLNVSRPHVVMLMEEGTLPFHKNGKHRRVRFTDLMQFKAERDRLSERSMQELARQAQALDMGYE